MERIRRECVNETNVSALTELTRRIVMVSASRKLEAAEARSE